ncbi:Centromere/kinetochore Zw10-domain-containing protein [Circinella umbellata]|nr:Centromere/kinetochore Zw10-domain-containing protein [Circinella umbellata]
MSTTINNERIQQEFITALFNENTDRDILLQSQKIMNDDNKALIAILSGLQDHSHILRQQVFETVRDNLDNFISLYTDCHQVHEKLDDILTQCQQEQQNSMTNDQGEEEATISKTLYTYHDTVQRVTENENEIQVLEKIQQLVQEIEECEQEIRSIINNNSDSVGELMQNVTRRYLTINKTLSKQQLFDDIDNSSTITVSHLLDEKCRQLKNVLVTTLEDKLTSTIIYQDNSTMEVYPDDNTQMNGKQSYLLDIFECYDMLDILSAEMANMKRSLFKNITTPLFDHSTTTHVSIHENILTLEEEGHGHDEDSNGKSAPEVACQMIHNIDLLLKFISEHIFNGSDKHTRLFGNLILPEIFQQLIQQALSPAIPPTASKLATFDPVTKAVYTLEHNCIQYYHFLDINNSNNSTNEPSTIINYVNNMDTHFATKRRDKLLLKGRGVMLRRLYDVEEIVDMDKKTNKLQQYQITQTPKLLAMLLIDTVKEANSLFSTPQASSSFSAYQLLNVVYDLLDLFRAIMPQFHRSQFLSSPQSALIFRNDCYWLANTLTIDLIPELNKNDINSEELVTKKHVFQEAIDNVRTLGESWFELAMAQWVRVLQNALNQTGKFINIAENQQRQQDCDHAIAQVIDQIRSYAVTLRPVISERIYFDLVSRVVDSVLTHLLGDIEDLQDIGAEDSHLIAQSLNSLIQLVDVFDSKDQGPATEPMVMQRVPSWRKFWFLKDMLDMNLRDIMDHYRRGELFMFEKKELIGLICALFADTDLRASMIREIQSTDPSPSMLSPSTSASPPPIEQRQQERSATPKISLLAMVDPDQEEEETGEGWGWDDEPIISSHNHHNKEEENNSTLNDKVKSNQLSMQLDDHEENTEGWGFDDGDDEPIISQQEEKISKDISNSKKSSPLSMQLDDEEEDGEGWGLDDDVPLVIQQEEEKPRGEQQPNKAKASSMPLEKEDSDKSGWKLDDNETLVTSQEQQVKNAKELFISQKQSPLSMQLDHNEEEEGEGWGFDDDEPLIIPQQEHEQERSEKEEHGKQKDELPLLSNPNLTTNTSSMMDLDQQQQNTNQLVLNNLTTKEDKKKIIPERSNTTTSSSLSMMEEDEDDAGWGDADEDVNFSHVH